MKESDAKRSPGQHDEPRLFKADQLFGQRREVTIEHNGEVYRLRITRNGKLILTK